MSSPLAGKLSARCWVWLCPRKMPGRPVCWRRWRSIRAGCDESSPFLSIVCVPCLLSAGLRFSWNLSWSAFLINCTPPNTSRRTCSNVKRQTSTRDRKSKTPPWGGGCAFPAESWPTVWELSGWEGHDSAPGPVASVSRATAQTWANIRVIRFGQGGERQCLSEGSECDTRSLGSVPCPGCHNVPHPPGANR